MTDQEALAFGLYILCCAVVLGVFGLVIYLVKS